jgi:ElaB/YqjD/DUF883 family membrane-anchored ribosome-binding protein
MNNESVSREKLVTDVKVVLSDAEDLLRATAADASERVKSLRPKLEESVRAARARVTEAERAVVDRTKAAAVATDRFAHENPWKIAGIAGGVGLLLGLLIGRRG